MSSINDRITEIDVQIAALTAERKTLLPQSTIACPGCGHEHVVGELVIIAWQAYVEPSGCTGGDYWYTSALGFKCLGCGQTPSWEERWSSDRPPKPSPLRDVRHVAAGCLEIERAHYAPRATLVGTWKADARERVIQDLTINGIPFDDKSTQRKEGTHP